MDIDDIRRTNISALEKEAGSATVAADRVGMSYCQYLNYRNGAKDQRSGKIRGMRKETAWRFEDAFGKPRGWLDQNHGDTPQMAREPTPYPYQAKPAHDRPLVQQICDIAERIDDTGLMKLQGYASCLLADHPLVKAKPLLSA